MAQRAPQKPFPSWETIPAPSWESASNTKLRSTAAPSLAQAPGAQLGVGVDLNRCRGRVGRLLGPDTLPTRRRRQ